MGADSTGEIAGTSVRMYSTIWPRVRNCPSSSGLGLGKSGYNSSSPPRISTRLMESIPKSASISIESSNISTG